MKIKKKTQMIMFFAVLILIVLVATFITKNKDENRPIRISINAWPGYAHAYVAQEKGFFKKNGVNIELVSVVEYTDCQDLFINNEVDGVFQVFTDTVLQNSTGFNSKVVYVSDYSTQADVIIAKQGINSIADLKGKTIGIEELNGFSHFFVLNLLEKAGLSELDIKFVIVPAHQITEAILNGSIDAGHTWEPETSKAINKGFKIIGMAGDVPGCITDVLSFNEDTIKNRPREIEAIVKSLLEARNYLLSNRDESLEIISFNLKEDVSSINNGIDGVHLLNQDENIDAIKNILHIEGEKIINFYTKIGQIGIPMKIDDVLEPYFVEAIKGVEVN